MLLHDSSTAKPSIACWHFSCWRNSRRLLSTIACGKKALESVDSRDLRDKKVTRGLSIAMLSAITIAELFASRRIQSRNSAIQSKRNAKWQTQSPSEYVFATGLGSLNLFKKNYKRTRRWRYNPSEERNYKCMTVRHFDCFAFGKT